MTMAMKTYVLIAVFIVTLGGVFFYLYSSPENSKEYAQFYNARTPVTTELSLNQVPCPAYDRLQGEKCFKIIGADEQNGKAVKIVTNLLQDQSVDAPRVPKNVFFDLGANNGDSLASFARLGGGVPQNWFGELPSTERNSSWEIFAFEANPVFTEVLKNVTLLLKEIRPKWKVHMFVESAIGTENKKVTFHLDTINVQYNYWGSSLLQTSDVNASVSAGKGKDVEVQMHSLSELLLDNCQTTDMVVVKMDVEGTEYELMKDMIITGAITLVDILLVEWHPTPNTLSPHQNTLKWLVKDKLRPWW